MARMRTIQPPHESEKFTLAEAMHAWRTVEALQAAARPPRAASATVQSMRLNVRTRVPVAADRALAG